LSSCPAVGGGTHVRLVNPVSSFRQGL
jgi:hypothetical protein